MKKKTIKKSKRKVQMKGIILAGGTGSRLWPLTDQTSKQMLPVGRVPMIFHPLNVLLKAGIKDILIITSPQHSGSFVNMLEPLLRPYGISIFSSVQQIPAGLPEAFTIGAPFIGEDNVTMILGDNIFEDVEAIADAVKKFRKGGCIFAKKVPDPERFAVATVNKKGIVTNIVEKPIKPESSLAIPGAYIYDNDVINVAKTLTPSERGEYEIVDLHNYYLQKGTLQLHEIAGEWLDAGTIESWHEANVLAIKKGFVEKFDPILLEALHKGFDRNKAIGKAQLHACRDID
ncbi:MAG: sugar phosphate nucleotidyltransferase [Parcubacteria group bacterium]|jgi:glucose-1-phosphate thymidylyltransferase